MKQLAHFIFICCLTAFRIGCALFLCLYAAGVLILANLFNTAPGNRIFNLLAFIIWCQTIISGGLVAVADIELFKQFRLGEGYVIGKGKRALLFEYMLLFGTILANSDSNRYFNCKFNFWLAFHRSKLTKIPFSNFRQNPYQGQISCRLHRLSTFGARKGIHHFKLHHNPSEIRTGPIAAIVRASGENLVSKSPREIPKATEENRSVATVAHGQSVAVTGSHAQRRPRHQTETRARPNGVAFTVRRTPAQSTPSSSEPYDASDGLDGIDGLNGQHGTAQSVRATFTPSKCTAVVVTAAVSHADDITVAAQFK